MNPKLISKLIVDCLMVATLLLLMSYELIGKATHEWMGTGMLGLFIFHLLLNWKWGKSILKGRYNILRVCQLILVVLLLISAVCLIGSGIILSRHVFNFLPIQVGRSFARKLHMFSAYWGFVLMAIHLGLHWNILLNRIYKMLNIKVLTNAYKWGSRILSMAFAGYGIYAFIKRNIGSYLLLKTQFAFFDFEEPLILFFIDYLSIISLFVFIVYYLKKRLIFVEHYIRRRSKTS